MIISRNIKRYSKHFYWQSFSLFSFSWFFFADLKFKKYIGSVWREAIERNSVYVQSSCNRWTIMFTIRSKRECFIFRAYTACFDVTGKVFWLIVCFCDSKNSCCYVSSKQKVCRSAFLTFNNQLSWTCL